MKTFLHKLSLYTLLMAAGLASGAGMSACSGGEPADMEQSAPKKESAEPAPAPAPAPDKKVFKDRLIFGLPMPPKVRSVTENKRQVRIKVEMSLQEVGEFFEQNLVDYEVLYPRDMVRAVGLRSYMPEVYAYPYGPFSFVVYSQGESQPKEAKPAPDDASQDRVIVSGRDVAPVRTYKKGDPILERTADGELLAPGARWGEPYTPPPGSPLDKVGFRANFGRPYGQWMAR